MNELLKTKYYNLIKNKDFNSYEKVGSILANIEDMLMNSNYKIAKEELVKLLLPIKEVEIDIYNEIIKDINSGLLYRFHYDI